MSLPGAVDPDASIAFIEEQRIAAAAPEERVPENVPQSPSEVTDSGDQSNLFEPPVVNPVAYTSQDLSSSLGEEVLNFDLQTESNADPVSASTSVGEPEALVPPLEQTNQRSTTTNPHSSQDSVEVHVIGLNSDVATASTAILSSNNDSERLRLNSEGLVADKWRRSTGPGRSTVSVDRNFCTVSRHYVRRFGGSEDRETPPHPLNTYQWEDVRRAREKVIGS